MIQYTPERNSIFTSDKRGVIAPALLTSGIKNPLFHGLGARLLKTRIAADLFMNRLSALAGLSVSVARSVEAAENVPTVETVALLSAALDVSPTWLAFGWEGFEPFRQRVPRKGETQRPDPMPNPGERLPSQEYKAIGQRLRQAREAAGLSLRAIARGCELSPQALSLIEGGRSIPLVSNVEAIALVLGVAPGWLAFGETDDGDVS